MYHLFKSGVLTPIALAAQLAICAVMVPTVLAAHIADRFSEANKRSQKRYRIEEDDTGILQLVEV